MLNLITNKPIWPIPPEHSPKNPRKPSKRISAKQVQNNLDAFIKEQRQFNSTVIEFMNEQRQVNKVLLDFVVEQKEFNKKIMVRIDQVEINLNARIDNLVLKNDLVE